MNSEQQAANTPGQGEQLPVAAADKSLTLAPGKLAGSARCLNCGTEMKGPFCYYCGQPDRNFMRFFPALFRDLMEDMFDLDSRFMRTIKPLLFKPGKLTRDYMRGRRFRYAPPMRLYIFSSIVFFLLAALLSTDSIEIRNSTGTDGIVGITTDTEEEMKMVGDPLNELPEGLRDKIDVDQTVTEIEDGAVEKEFGFETDDIQFNGEPWNRETNPVDIQWLPDWLNDRINDEIEGSPDKAREINENPNLIIDKVFDILPATMFILLPVVALIFKFWYLFATRYYMEHLIFSLHNHSFLFVSLILIFLTNLASALLAENGYGTAATIGEWMAIAIGSWIPIYLLISLRVVYQQNWLLTLGKFTVIGFSYLTLLSIVTSGVAIASFVLL